MQQHVSATRAKFAGYPRLLESVKEKRSKPRQNIYMLVKYRTARMSSYAEGILCNLSQEGALFYTLDDLKLTEKVQMMIAPDRSQASAPIQLSAEIVRRETSNSAYNSFNYGCRISQIDDPNMQLSSAVRANLFSLMAQQRCA